MKKLIELFAGSRSIGRIAERRGWSVCSMDLMPFAGIDVIGDISTVRGRDFPFVPDAIWASPPCTTFSVASLRHHWTVDGLPKTREAHEGIELIRHTLRVIRYFLDRNNRMAFYIENPRGKLRSLPLFRDLPRVTVTYCKYGDMRMKPTDIWTNNLNDHRGRGWKPRKACFAGNPDCHHEQCAHRLWTCGTQGLRNAYERSKIPAALAREVLDAVIA
jgi:hypothetical protein